MKKIIALLLSVMFLFTAGCFDSKSTLKSRVNDYYKWHQGESIDEKSYDFFPPSSKITKKWAIEEATWLKDAGCKLKDYSIEFVRMNESESLAEVTVITTSQNRLGEFFKTPVKMVWKKFDGKWYIVYLNGMKTVE